MNVLTSDNVVKRFTEGKQTVEVLRGVSLDAGRGEIVALEGPSGSGKTTFLSILGCILTPTEGRVVVDGHEVDPSRPEELPAIRRKSIGFVFQQFNLFPALSALENVEYSLNVRGVGGRAAREEAARVLDRVGLGDRLHFLPEDLSGGQKQRVAIARALAGSPPVVLADEPTANLDTAVGGQVLDLFRELAKAEDKGLLVVTHDPKVRRIADRVVAIRDGALVGEAAAEPGADAAALREVRRRSIGFVFQQYNLFPALSALENVEYSLNVRGVGGHAARDEAGRVLDRVGLGDRLHFPPEDLSGGQKQRVAIARALAGSPPVVLADEPTANLDTAVGGQVLDLFRELAKREQKGLLVVTHDPKVRRIADRVVAIRDGALVGEDGAMAGADAAGVAA